MIDNDTNPQGDAGVPDNTPMSVNDARTAMEGLLSDELGSDTEPQQATQPDDATGPEADASSDTANDAEDETGGEDGDEQAEADTDTDADETTDDEQGDEDETPAIEPPIGLSAEEKAAWDKLPRESQEFIQRQEKQRTADYQRKTQAVAEQRKQAEQELTQAQKQRQEYADNLTVVQSMIESSLQADPQEMQRLYNENPTEWARMNELQRQGRERLNAVRGEVDRLRQQSEQEHKRQLQTELQDAAQRLPELIPEWSAPETAKAEKAQLSGWLMEQGFTREQIAQNTNPYLIAMARKAMLYDRQQATRQTAAKKAAPAKAPAKVAKPTASKRSSKSAAANDRVSRDFDQFRRAPSRDSAARAIEHLIDD